MKKAIRTITAMALVLAMAIQQIPVISALDNEQPPVQTEVQENTSQNEQQHELETEKPEPKIIGELVEKRERRTKYFKRDDDSIVAAVYPEAVHFKKDGKWEDIDNSLFENTDSNGNAVLENKLNDYIIKFSKNADNENLVNFEKDECKISWKLDNVVNISGEYVTPIDDTQNLTADEKAKVVKNQKSVIEYKDIVPNVILQYVLSSENIKENIILNSSSAQTEFTFTYDFGSMEAILNEDKTISVFNPESPENVLFSFDAPYMYDSNEEHSDNIEVKLIKEDNKYKLTLIANKEWLDDEQRVYPVTIDPSIKTDQSRENIQDAFVYSKSPDINRWNADMLRVGISSGKDTHGSIFRSYIKINIPTEIGSADRIIDAKLSLIHHRDTTRYTPSNNGMRINVHEVTQNWDEYTITWSKNIKYNPEIEDYSISNFSTTTASFDKFDITKLVQKWHIYGNNNGVMLKSENEDEYKEAYFYSKDLNDAYETIRPMISITYRNFVGLENYWTYHSQNVGRAGTGYVNDYTGNLVWTQSNISMGGSRMPASVSFVYNANYRNNNTYTTGYGWWLSCYEHLLWEKNEDLKPNYPIVYWDEDRTRHHFISDGTNKYKDEDGLGLSFEYFPNNSFDNKFILLDKSGNKKTFDAGGWLKKVTDSNGNSYTINYGKYNNQKRVSTIVGTGGTITFAYHPSSVLDYIEDPSGRRTYYQFTWSNPKNGYLLTKITYPDGKAVNYEYDNNASLTKAIDIDGYNISYNYTTVSPYRVNRYSENKGTNKGSYVDISYDYNGTVFKENGDSERVSTYQFNNWGQTVCIKNAQGEAQYYEQGTSGGSTNKTTIASKVQKTSVNLIQNGNVEVLDNWTHSLWGGATGTSGLSTTKYLGKNSISLNKTNTSSSSRLLRYQKINVPEKGADLTLSAYVKPNGISSSSNGGATLLIYYTDPSGIVKYAESEKITGTNDWKRISVSTNIPYGSTKAYACLTMLFETGTAYFDCIQLERGQTPSRYNLLENNGLDFSQNGTPRYWTTANKESGDGTYDDDFESDSIYKNLYKMRGNPSLHKNLKQEVYIDGNAGDSYVFGGWAKGYSVPSYNRTYPFTIVVEFYNSSNQCIERSTVDFNYGTNDWQYASKPYVTKNAYSKIKYYLCYYNNANTVFFDGAQLYREEFGESYTYDSKGNVISSKDLAKNQSTFDYNQSSNELIKAINPQGAEFKYTYNSSKPHQLDSATGSGVKYSFGYDSYGNPTSTKAESVNSSNPHIISSASYTSNGNYIKSLTDARGNTINYSYDELKGTLKSVTDTNGIPTNYTYNPNTDVLESVSKNNTVNGTTKNITNSYTYTNDRLNTINHNGFNYSFNYDWTGNTTKVNVGSQNLITNQYNIAKGLLTRATYGNGFYKDYSYDVQDRLIQEKFNNVPVVQYVYNNEGALGILKDLVNKVDYKYTYDLSGRLVRRQGSNGFKANTFYTKDNVTANGYLLNNTYNVTNYNFDKDNRLTKMFWNRSKNYATYSYDGLNRLTSKNIFDNSTRNNLLTTKYTFVAGNNASKTDNNATTTLLESITNGNNPTISYTYDKNGNIETISESGAEKARYYYDSLNQLIRENNKYTNQTVAYVYDNGGNILSKTTYPYTTGSLDGVTGTTINYGYGDSNWKDKMTSYNGQAITYDQIGNPLTYRDGMTFTWKNGRQLNTFKKDDTSLSFKYDTDGLRTQKIANNKVTDYYTDGGKIIYETKKDTSDNITDTLYYSYDTNGDLVGFNLKNSTYTSGEQFHYIRNGQNDIIGIVDNSGNQVVSYTYDSWGNSVSITGSLASTVGEINPFRYRGYYYDVESGLYYLQSRYYDAEVGRFINADSQLNPQAGLTGMNMFCYGGNNPVNITDPTGHAFMFLTAAIGAIVGGVVGAIVTKSLKGALIGAAVGGLVGLGAGAGAGALLAGSATASTTTVMTGGSALVATVSGGGVGSGVSYIANNVKKAISSSGQQINNGASNINNAIRLKQQLLSEQASSIFNDSGMLKQEIINTSRAIIQGQNLGNTAVINALTSDGSSIDQWAKMTTQVINGPTGPFQVHFYQNQVTGIINIFEMKCKLCG